MMAAVRSARFRPATLPARLHSFCTFWGAAKARGPEQRNAHIRTKKRNKRGKEKRTPATPSAGQECKPLRIFRAMGGTLPRGFQRGNKAKKKKCPPRERSICASARSLDSMTPGWLCFLLKARVTPLSLDESGSQPTGRSALAVTNIIGCAAPSHAQVRTSQSRSKIAAHIASHGSNSGQSSDAKCPFVENKQVLGER